MENPLQKSMALYILYGAVPPFQDPEIPIEKMDDFGGTSMTQRKPFQQIRWETSANIGAFTGMMLMTYGLMPLRS